MRSSGLQQHEEAGPALLVVSNEEENAREHLDNKGSLGNALNLCVQQEWRKRCSQLHYFSYAMLHIIILYPTQKHFMIPQNIYQSPGETLPLLSMTISFVVGFFYVFLEFRNIYMDSLFFSTTHNYDFPLV